MKINHILFVANKSLLVMDDPAFLHAVKIAKHNHADICVLMAINDNDIPGFEILSQTSFDKVKADFLNTAYEQLQLQVPEIATTEIHVKIRVGIEFIEIIKESVEGNYDLIVKTPELQQSTISSLDLHLVRKSQVPLLLERHFTYDSSNTIVCAIDLTLEQHESGQAFNDRLMATTSEMAASLNMQITVISCWSMSGEEYLHNNPFMSVKGLDLNNLCALEEDKHKELQKSFLTRYPDCEAILIKGEPDTTITRYMNTNRQSMLVMGSSTHTGVMGYLIGNNAENIILNTRASLMTIKPAGFISPVF